MCLKLSIPEKIRIKFEKIAYAVFKTDYLWDKDIEQIIEGLNDPNLIYASLNMIYQIFKHEIYIKNYQRKHPLDIIAIFSPKILEIMKNLVLFPTIDCFSYVLLILNIYWLSMDIDLYSHQAILDEWMTCFRIILEYPMGDLQNKPDSEESEKIQEKLPQWMCKRYVAQIVNRFFIKYFKLYHSKNQDLFVGQHFKEIWVVEFFKVIIKQLFQVHEKFIPKLLLSYYLRYTNQSVEFLPTFSLLDEHSKSFLMFNVIMSLLYRVKLDDQLWKNHPIDFIRKEGESSIGSSSPKIPAIELLESLCKKGSLINFFEFLNREIQQSTDLVRKEGIMLVLGWLSNYIRTSSINQHIETMLTDFVFCEFTSQIGFMRYRAVWVYNRFSYLNSQSLNLKALGLKALNKLLVDSELPVRYEASLALPKLLKGGTPKGLLNLEIRNVLEIYFKLLNEIHSDKVMEALESIISAFGKEIIPFTVELTLNLSRAFSRMIEKDSSESEVSAQSALNTIQKVIDILIKSSDSDSDFDFDSEPLMKISFILNPIFDYCLSERGSYFEEAIHILSSLLYCTPDNSMPHLYYLMKILHTSILGEGTVIPFALGYIDNILPAVVNFIKKYKGQTLENLPWILQMAFRLLKGNRKEAIFGCQILISILENYKFALDPYLLGILSEISEAFAAGSNKLKIFYSKAVSIALWNSPLLTLSAEPLISSALQFSLVNIKKYKSVISRTHMIYGFGSLFCVIPQLPRHIINTLPAVFRAILQLWNFLDEDELSDNQEATVNFTVESQNIIEINRVCESDHEEDSLSFDENAEILYVSPFENIDQERFIKDIALNLYENYPEIIDSILRVLTKTEAQLLESLINVDG